MSLLLRAVVLSSVTLLGWGCVRDARFDPEGCDWNLLGAWTIDGLPANAENCGNDKDGGITEVQLFIWNEEVDDSWSDNQVLLFECNAFPDDGGSPTFLNTSLNEKRCKKTGRILKEGPYLGQWVARDSLNNILDCKPLEMLEPPTAPDDVVDVGVANFLTDALENTDAGSVLDICPASSNTPP